MAFLLQILEERVRGGGPGEAQRRIHPGWRSQVGRAENHESPPRVEQTTGLGGGE